MFSVCRNVVAVSFGAALLCGCSHNFSKEEVEASIPAGTIKPDIDYSAESPDCETAAQRIAENIQVGMTLADVKRLVGKPRVVLPGSFWWTPGFSLSGKPTVRYAFGPAEDNVPVTAFSTDTSGC